MAETSPASLGPALVAERAAGLEAAFQRIAAQRMAGVALLNPSLRVQAVGFRLHRDDPEGPDAQEAACGPVGISGDIHPYWALGVLVTPWFMNLVRLPLEAAARPAAPGSSQWRTVASRPMEFFGAAEDGVGGFEACSLFSPMFEFADQAAALAVAAEVLRLLRPTGALTRAVQAPGQGPTQVPVKAPVPATAADSSLPAPGVAPAGEPRDPCRTRDLRDLRAAPVASRRGFLLGRSASGEVR